jgi:peptidoglycan/xylan/chitin deacetylase (PgdA/CDA1 family)
MKQHALILVLVCLSALFAYTNGGNVSVPISCKKEGMIALTYDEGMGYQTGLLLNTLNEHNVKAAFHITTDYLDNAVVKAYLVKAIEDDHIVGLRVSPDMLNMPVDELKSTLLDLAERISQETKGYKVKYVRVPPSPTGIPEEHYKMFQELNYTVTSFNLDSKDYEVSKMSERQMPVLESIKSEVEKIEPPARGAYIIACRDSVAETVKETGQIIEYLEEKKYNIVRLDECIGNNSSMPADGDNKNKTSAAYSISGIDKTALTLMTTISIAALDFLT